MTAVAAAVAAIGIGYFDAALCLLVPFAVLTRVGALSAAYEVGPLMLWLWRQ